MDDQVIGSANDLCFDGQYRSIGEAKPSLSDEGVFKSTCWKSSARRAANGTSKPGPASTERNRVSWRTQLTKSSRHVADLALAPLSAV